MAKKPGLSIILGGDLAKWQKWALAFDGSLKVASERALRKASLYALSEIHNKIKGGRYTRLAPLTLLLRQLEGYGSTPLVRRGRLLRALTHDVINQTEAHVGLTLNAFKDRKGNTSNIGKLLHDGGTIRVTEAMRRAFMRKLGRLSQKKGVSLVKRRGSSKGRIRIKPRRYIGDVFEDAMVARKIESIYFESLAREAGFR